MQTTRKKLEEGRSFTCAEICENLVDLQLSLINIINLC